MSASKRKSILALFGKPVASSTPIKGLFDSNTENFSVVEKKRDHGLQLGVNKLPNAGECKSASIQVIQNKYQLEIMTSDSGSDSDVMPYKKTKLISSRTNQSSATIVNNILRKKNLGKAERPKTNTSRKKVQNYEVSSLSASDNEVISPLRSKVISSRKLRPHEPSLKTSDINVDVNHNGGDRLRSKTISKRSTSINIAKEKASTDLQLISGKKPNNLQTDHKKIRVENKKISVSPEVMGNESLVRGSKVNFSSDHESSSDNSDHEENYLRNRRKPLTAALTEEADLRIKKKSSTLPTDKIIGKKLATNLSSISHKPNKDSIKNVEKITTPVTGMPPARTRQVLSRTLSRISLSSSDKFMVEIPKSLADSFSASLQLIKRKIDFENIDEPKKQRFYDKDAGVSKNKKTDVERVDELKNQEDSDGKRNERKNESPDDGKADGSTSKTDRTDLKGINESKKQKVPNRKNNKSKKEKKQNSSCKSPHEADSVTVPRKLTALIKPGHSPEKETTEARLEGVRKSSRTRIPPIAYWVGNDSKEGNQLFAENQIKTKSSSRASVTVPRPRQEKKNHVKDQPSLPVGKIKHITKQKEKTEPRKSVRWEDDSRQESRNADSTHQMKVCFSTFNESVFVGADDEDEEDEIGVQSATSLQTRDMHSEFIKLLPGAQTTDLMSYSFNQLYTVLENTVLLYVEGAPKQFNLHSQFYVHKGASHKLRNNSKNPSLILQVIIQK